MKIWKRIRTVLLLAWLAESLILHLGWFALTLWWGKLRAVRAYARALRRAGLPHADVQEFVSAYDISLGDVIKTRWNLLRWRF